ncbi:MAG TPA: hypothetical protein VGP13_00535 [Candidatus Paceibacterota bacterium]|jgi:hypothetical protein|nr:hypothetical protein [Candidatus Paceibacterota bacterium]
MVQAAAPWGRTDRRGAMPDIKLTVAEVMAALQEVSATLILPMRSVLKIYPPSDTATAKYNAITMLDKWPSWETMTLHDFMLKWSSMEHDDRPELINAEFRGINPFWVLESIYGA